MDCFNIYTLFHYTFIFIYLFLKTLLTATDIKIVMSMLGIVLPIGVSNFIKVLYIIKPVTQIIIFFIENNFLSLLIFNIKKSAICIAIIGANTDPIRYKNPVISSIGNTIAPKVPITVTATATHLNFILKNIVLDPVMVATSGSNLMENSAIKSIQTKLFPLARVITPNIPEAEVLSGISIKDDKDMLDAAKIIHERYFCAVLLKGGHSINDANDLLYENKKAKWFLGKRIDNKNTHGTGCSLSSAIASNLAKGYTLEESVQRAKNYISDALLAMLDIGKGSGPLNHAFNINGEYAKEADNE